MMPKSRPGKSASESYPWLDDMYRFYGKRRRSSRGFRIAIAVVGLILCYVLFIHSSDGSSAWTSNTPSLLPSDDPNPSRESRQASGTTSGRSKKQQQQQAQRPEPRPDETILDTDTGRPDFTDQDILLIEAGLKHIFAIAPDEIHVRELLRSIDGTGKERLRETGVRARAFRTLFEPWETLHVVSSENGTFVRDDIVTYLRQTPSLAGISTSRSRAEIIRAYENYRYFLTRLSSLLFPWTAPYFADHMTLHAHLQHGRRGIVLSGGDGQLGYLMTSAKSIRKLGCTLPIEVMYLGDDDLGDDSRAELESIPDVITRDMKQMVMDKGWDLKGWAGKPFAMLLSSFREVLFIDADAMFFKNPALLFQDPAYLETGALFFRDRLMFPENKRKWLQQILPKPVSSKVRQSRFWTGESGHMQESGVVVVDKFRHFMALLMVTRMNGPDRDGDKDKGIVGIYDMVYGDKETFWLGWELVGDHDYAFHSGDAGNMGVAYADRGDSPKIAHTAAMIGKHAELGSLAGSYDTSSRSGRRQKHRGKPGAKDKPRKKAAAEPAADLDAATKGDKDFKIFDDEKEDDTDLADTPRVREYEEENRFDDEDDEDEDDDNDDEGGYAPELGAKRKRSLDLEPSESEPETESQPEHAGRLFKRAPGGRKTKTKPISPPDHSPMDRADSDIDNIDDLPAPKGQPLLQDSDDDANYTICAPQLLHLDRDGRPLWFNGWILDNKFDKDHASPSKFSVFMREKRDDQSTANWMLQKNNMCCLQSDKIHRFTLQEKQSLKMIVDTAREVGAFGKKRFDD